MNVLVVGAGAVGQVFGRHLQKAGAHLTFFVKEKHLEETKRGFDVYPLKPWGGAKVASRFEGFDVVTQAEEVERRQFDQVYISVASTGLEGPWLRPFLAAVKDATVVSLQPSPEDHATILRNGLNPEQLVAGLIGFIAYQAPLPTEKGFPTPGIAYLFPPLSRSLFSGQRVDSVVRLLRAGGLPAAKAKNIAQRVAFPTTALMSYLAALELAGWSFETFRHDGWSSVGAKAVREALAIVSKDSGKPPPPFRLIAFPWTVRWGLVIAARLLPFPLEPYLRKHFTKVGGQTRFLLHNVIAKGKEQGAKVEVLEELVKSLGPVPE
jgi:ketopantoate reductase